MASIPPAPGSAEGPMGSCGGWPAGAGDNLGSVKRHNHLPLR